jgi:hypothetical protein
MEEQREAWARRISEHLVDAMLATCERQSIADQEALMRAIARRALWRMPNAPFEARELAKAMEIENMKQPHPRDTPPGRD